MEKETRVAIIGAGEAGLLAAKYCKEYKLLPDIYDRANSLGGLWGSSSTNHTAIYCGLTANISTYTMTFSDHSHNPIPSIIPDQSTIYEYFHDYATKFDLIPHLRLNTTVNSVRQEINKKWTVESTHNNEKISEEYDFLIIASGLHSRPIMPNIQGMENFKGLIMHSSEFKLDDERLKNKKVVVSGSSFSATDVASHLVGHAKSITSVFRRPYLIANRLMAIKTNNGYNIKPIDCCLFSKHINELSSEEVKNYYSNLFSRQIQRPLGDPLYFDLSTESPRLAFSDFYLDYVNQGEINAIKTTISRFEENRVVLEDGTTLEAEVVIFGTGFRVNSTYFNENILQTLNYDPNRIKSPYILYKFTFHPDLPNMAMINQRDDSFFLKNELQAKLAALVFSGRKDLPSYEVMKNEIISIENGRENGSNEISYIDLIELLSRETGCEPDLDHLRNADPDLYRMLSFNCPISAFMLLNTDKNEEARHKLTEFDRIINQVYELNEDYTVQDIYDAFFERNNDNFTIPPRFRRGEFRRMLSG